MNIRLRPVQVALVPRIVDIATLVQVVPERTWCLPKVVVHPHLLRVLQIQYLVVVVARDILEV